MLTNNSIYTPRDLRARLCRTGLDMPEEAIWTSALATAKFLADQRPGGTAYVIGEAGLTTALHEVGYVLTEFDPDYVVLGETRTYSFEAITTAIRLINGGARFIATNPDATGPSDGGRAARAGSVAAMITKATGVEPYFVGKPNPMMMRSALNRIGAHSETHRDDRRPDGHRHRAGLEAGLRTILVLTGITRAEDVEPLPVPAEPGRQLGRGPGRRAADGLSSGRRGGPEWSTPTGTPAWTDRRGGDFHRRRLCPRRSGRTLSRAMTRPEAVGRYRAVSRW